MKNVDQLGRTETSTWRRQGEYLATIVEVHLRFSKIGQDHGSMRDGEFGPECWNREGFCGTYCTWDMGAAEKKEKSQKRLLYFYSVAETRQSGCQEVAFVSRLSVDHSQVVTVW